MSGFNNRRRLRDDQDSYKKTGVPWRRRNLSAETNTVIFDEEDTNDEDQIVFNTCLFNHYNGNPQRYGSSEVMRMDPVTCLGKRKLIIGDLDTETEGEKQLQAMAKKQLNTNITLNEQIARHRSFSSSGEYKPSVRTLCGVSHLDNYQEILEQDNTVEELKKCGLTEDEIRLKLGTRKGESRYGLHPEAHSGKLEEINQRISERNNSLAISNTNTKSGTIEMGRRELEIEHRLIGDNSQARALSNFLTKQKVIKGDPNDPINKLPELMDNIEKKGRELKGKSHGRNQNTGERPYVGVDGDSSSGDRDGDFIGPRLPEDERDTTTKPTEPNPPPRVPPVDADGRRVVMDTVEEVPDDVIKKYRLKVEDIRALPRFENYSPGEPSNVLYLKNLSNKVTEEDLVSLFDRYQTTDSEKIVYRLMTGRMRGQAFVTFHDTKTAKSALELVNGYQFRGKPIIIQFGRKSPEV